MHDHVSDINQNPLSPIHAFLAQDLQVILFCHVYQMGRDGTIVQIRATFANHDYVRIIRLTLNFVNPNVLGFFLGEPLDDGLKLDIVLQYLLHYSFHKLFKITAMMMSKSAL